MKKLLLLAVLASFGVNADQTIYNCDNGYQVKFNLFVPHDKGYVAVMHNGKEIASEDNTNISDVYTSATLPDWSDVENMNVRMYDGSTIPVGGYTLVHADKNDAEFVGGFFPVAGHEAEDTGGKATLFIYRFNAMNQRLTLQCSRKPFRG